MTLENIKNNQKGKSLNTKPINYGKGTMSKMQEFLSGIIKETGLNKKSGGNFLKNERKNQEEN